MKKHKYLYVDLCYACRNGDIQALEKLISRGCDINMDDSNALFLAVHHNKIEAVKFLLANGANLDVIDDDIFNTAVDNVYYDIVQVLINHRRLQILQSI